MSNPRIILLTIEHADGRVTVDRFDNEDDALDLASNVLEADPYETVATITSEEARAQDEAAMDAQDYRDHILGSDPSEV